MPRQSSPEKQIKRLKADANRLRGHWTRVSLEMMEVRKLLTHMTNDRDEWKRRFDALLALKVQQGETR